MSAADMNNAIKEASKKYFRELNRIKSETVDSWAEAKKKSNKEKQNELQICEENLNAIIEALRDCTGSLSINWSEDFVEDKVESEVVANNDSTVSYRRRASPTRLKINISGNAIQERTAAETFVEALKTLGFDEVARLNLSPTPYPLLSKTEKSPYSSHTLQSGEWNVNFPTSTQSKKDCIEEICKKLNKPAQVEIVSK
jgi:hypothetical protein